MGNTKSREMVLSPEQMEELRAIGNCKCFLLMVMKNKTAQLVSERQVYYHLDLFYDEYPSGALDKETFVRENSETHAGTLQMWSHIFDELDKNGDGYFDFKEYLISIAVGTNSTNEEKLLFAFKIFDIDGNGYIDYYEFSQLYHFIFGKHKENEEMEAKNQTVSEDKEIDEKCRRLFEKLDANSQDGKLSMPEFVHGLKDDPIMVAAFTIF